MAMAAAAAAAARGAPCLLSKNEFLRQSSSATATTARVARRAGESRAVILLGVPPRSGRRDEWDAGAEGGGRLVDEDMATLRRRIREARARAPPGAEDEEGNDGDGLGFPAEWAALERREQGSCMTGVLRALVARTRPGLRAGVAALLLLAVPASVLLLLSARLMEAVDSISAAVLNGR